MRRYYNVEPKVARLLEPGDRYPMEKVVAQVVKTSTDVLVTFDDGSAMRLAYDDALFLTAPEAGSPADVSADAVAAAAAVLAAAEPVGVPADEVDAGGDDTGAAVETPSGQAK